MTPITVDSAEHQRAWELLPWYVNARIAEGDRARVESHLRNCAACRDELAQQRQIHQAMAADSGIEHIPTASLKRLLQRLDGVHAVTAPPAAATTVTPWLASARGLMVASVAIIAVALSVVAAVLWTQSQRGAPLPANYYTVTSLVSRAPDEAIRAVFSPSITLAELQALLDEAQLKIVAGPTEAGVYALATTSAQPVSWSLQRLRGHDSVRFAEATGPASEPGHGP
jgi:anti-sigma factor RsiW